MRFMILIVLALAAFVIALAVYAPLRLTVEDALFARKAEPAAPALPATPPPAEQPAQTDNQGQEPAAGNISAVVNKVLPGATTGEPAAVEPPAQPAGLPPQQQPSPARGGQLQPWERVVFPPALRRVQFGMPAQQVRQGFAIAWHKEEKGELMLTHNASPDKSTVVRFHFDGDSLYKIEVRIKPSEGQDRGGLYEQYRAYYAQLYARVPERSETRWSDGTVTAKIQLIRDGVEVIFTCPNARR